MLDKRRSRYVRREIDTIYRTDTAIWREDAGYDDWRLKQLGMRPYTSLGRLL
jgi:hypothetical protein